MGLAADVGTLQRFPKIVGNDRCYTLFHVIHLTLKLDYRQLLNGSVNIKNVDYCSTRKIALDVFWQFF